METDEFFSSKTLRKQAGIHSVAEYQKIEGRPVET